MKYLKYCSTVPNKNGFIEYTAISGISHVYNQNSEPIIVGRLFDSAQNEFTVRKDFVEWFLEEFNTKSIIDVTSFDDTEIVVYSSTGNVLSRKLR